MNLTCVSQTLRGELICNRKCHREHVGESFIRSIWAQLFSPGILWIGFRMDLFCSDVQILLIYS